MAREFNGTTQYFNRTSAVLSSEPITFSCWFNADTADVNQNLLSFGESSTDAFIRIAVISTNKLRAQSRDDTGIVGQGDSTTTFSTGAWNHAAGVFTSASSRSVFLNGGGKATDTTALGVASLNRTSVGALVRISVGQHFDGQIAEAAIWNVALTDSEILTLSKGYSPLLVRPQNIVAYWPLFARATDEEDWVASNLLTNTNGATRAAHPARIIYPVRSWAPVVIEGGAGGVTVVADPLVAATTLIAAPVIHAQSTADPLSAISALSADVSTGVKVTADPLTATIALSADQHISAGINAEPLTAITSLSAAAQISVNQSAEPLIAEAILSGSSAIGIHVTADPLTATTALSADIEAGAGITINAQPLTATTSLSASPIISVLQSADPIIVSSTLLADAYVSVNVTADALGAETALFGTVEAGVGVQISASPLTLTSSLSGEAVTGVHVISVPLSLIASLSASTTIGVNQAASPLILTASLLGSVQAGAVVINTGAKETLHLAAENPTLNLTP